MKYFPPTLYAALNMPDYGSKTFSFYIRDKAHKEWESNTKKYHKKIRSFKRFGLVEYFYNFYLHDLQIVSLESGTLSFANKLEIGFDCSIPSIEHGIFPSFLYNDNSFGCFLYEEFSEKNGNLCLSFYCSNGNLVKIDNITSIYKM